MKGLSNEHVALLNKEDLIRIKGTLKRVYEKQGKAEQLKELYPCPYRKLEALIKEWDEETEMASLLALCFAIAFRKTEDYTLADTMGNELIGIVKKAIKEIDEFEFGCRCH
jgi:hypothetical protein